MSDFNKMVKKLALKGKKKVPEPKKKKESDE